MHYQQRKKIFFYSPPFQANPFIYCLPPILPQICLPQTNFFYSPNYAKFQRNIPPDPYNKVLRWREGVTLYKRNIIF